MAIFSGNRKSASYKIEIIMQFVNLISIVKSHEPELCKVTY